MNLSSYTFIYEFSTALCALGIIQRSVSSWNRLNDMQEPCLPVKYLRTPGYRPAPEDNPYNAWSVDKQTTNLHIYIYAYINGIESSYNTAALDCFCVMRGAMELN